MRCCLIRFEIACAVLIVSLVAPLSTLQAEENSPAQGADSPKYKLAYKFTPGQEVWFVSTYRGKMDVRKEQVKQSDKITTKLWKHFTVTDVTEEGTSTLELKLDKAHMTAQFGDAEPTVFKSDDENFHPPKFRDTLSQIGKVTARVDYSRSGKLLKVVDSTGKQNVAPENAPPRDHQGFMVPLPETSVAIGEKWKDPFQHVVSLKRPLTRNIDMQRIYTLKSVQGNLAEISFNTVVLTPVHDPKVLAQLMQKQTEGTITFDIEQGLIIEKSIQVNKTVINPFGAGSSMQAVSTFTETLQRGKTVAENSLQPETSKN